MLTLIFIIFWPLDLVVALRLLLACLITLAATEVFVFLRPHLHPFVVTPGGHINTRLPSEEEPSRLRLAQENGRRGPRLTEGVGPEENWEQGVVHSTTEAESVGIEPPHYTRPNAGEDITRPAGVSAISGGGDGLGVQVGPQIRQDGHVNMHNVGNSIGNSITYITYLNTDPNPPPTPCPNCPQTRNRTHSVASSSSDSRSTTPPGSTTTAPS